MTYLKPQKMFKRQHREGLLVLARIIASDINESNKKGKKPSNESARNTAAANK